MKQAADIAFDPEGFTAAFVVTWKGRIIAERYGPNITLETPLESWSMGKSLSATLMGVLLKRGDYDLWQPAPIPEWQSPGDPRAKIRIADILRMSSGLRIKAPQDPDFDPKGTYPDHLYLYTGDDRLVQVRRDPAAGMAAQHGRPLSEHRPGAHQLPDAAGARQDARSRITRSRRKRSSTGSASATWCSRPIRTGTSSRRATSSAPAATGRGWPTCTCRTACGTASGSCPKGSSRSCGTLAPAWEADKRPIYGGFFWLNGDETFPVPRDAYYMSGVGGQTTLIVPSHDLVIVRLGHYKGAGPGGRALRKAIAVLMETVPKTH